MGNQNKYEICSDLVEKATEQLGDFKETQKYKLLEDASNQHYSLIYQMEKSYFKAKPIWDKDPNFINTLAYKAKDHDIKVIDSAEKLYNLLGLQDIMKLSDYVDLVIKKLWNFK